MKKIIYIYLTLTFVFLICKIDAKADTIKYEAKWDNYNVQLLDDNTNSNENDVTDSSENDQSNCSVLGSFKEDLQEIFKMIRIFAPLLAAVISVYEYLAALFMKNADELKKANSRLINRLFLIAALWLLPTFLNLVLDLIDKGDYSACIK